MYLFQFIEYFKFVVTVKPIIKMIYHVQLMQRDYHFVSTIDRHDVISGKVVVIVAKSMEVGYRSRGSKGTCRGSGSGQ